MHSLKENRQWCNQKLEILITQLLKEASIALQFNNGLADGGWTYWSFWSSCSVTCGNGHATRQRSCSNPTPANGGLTCAGSRTEQNTCTMAKCPGNDLSFVKSYR